jgi:hypothetical protein
MASSKQTYIDADAIEGGTVDVLGHLDLGVRGVVFVRDPLSGKFLVVNVTHTDTGRVEAVKSFTILTARQVERYRGMVNAACDAFNAIAESEGARWLE